MWPNAGHPGGSGCPQALAMDRATQMDPPKSGPATLAHARGTLVTRASDLPRAAGRPTPRRIAMRSRRPLGLLCLPALLMTLVIAKQAAAVTQLRAPSTAAYLVGKTASRPLATLPTTDKSIEPYIAVSSGLGGFPLGNVYVVVRQKIFQISPNGSNPKLFKKISGLSGGNNGITFDTVGTFGFNMLITDRRGLVWTVTSSKV